MFTRKTQLMGKPEDIIYKLEHKGSYKDGYDNKVDMYVLYLDQRTQECISLVVPHGREDIAQYIQERLNKCTTE